MKRVIPRRTPILRLSSFAAMAQAVFSKQSVRKGYLEFFKKNFSDYLKIDNLLGVHSARAGFYLLLRAFGLEKGDEIIMPAYNFHLLPAIAKAIGLVPKFVDIDPATYNIKTSRIEKKITPRTKVILVIHMSGLSCDLEPVLEIARKNNLKVIEDCAQSLGAEYRGKKAGSFADASFFSFDFNKNMPCFLGGIVAIRNQEIFDKAQTLLKKYSFSDWLNFLKNIATNTVLFLAMKKPLFTFFTYPLLKIFDWFGSNYIDSLTHSEVMPLAKIPEFYHLPLNYIQAAVGLRQLAELERVNQKTEKNAKLLNEKLRQTDGIKIPSSPPDRRHIYLYYRLLVGETSRFRKKLLKKGIDCLPSCMLAVSELSFLKTDNSKYPDSVRAAQGSLEIPNGPFLEKEDIIYIAEKIKEVNAEITRKV
jgi:dTDP-4-amino-4,6-dideoxygalactose transaminase